MPDKSILIRYATSADVGNIAAVFRGVVSNLEIYNEEARRTEIAKYDEGALEAKMDEDPMSISVAIKDQRIVGFIITTDQHGPIWVEWYGVSEEARHEGIGSLLMKHLISELPRRNATKLWCDTRTNNIPSVQLFEKLSFKRLCLLKNHWYGQDFYLWERMAKD